MAFRFFDEERINKAITKVRELLDAIDDKLEELQIELETDCEEDMINAILDCVDGKLLEYGHDEMTYEEREKVKHIVYMLVMEEVVKSVVNDIIKNRNKK